jgi:hypothetical protein
MLELHEEADFDVMVGLDCDVVVVDDFSDQVPGSSVGAKPVDYDPFTDREWRRLYEGVGVRPPPKTLRATSSGKAIVPYFNSGVITVPKEMCGELRGQWDDCQRQILAFLDRAPSSIRPDLHIYVDQIALALALARGKLPWVALPVGMNFPAKLPVHRSALRQSPGPMILHHHGHTDRDGFLLRPRCAAAIDAADRFNVTRAERLAIRYTGLRKGSVQSRRLRVRVLRALVDGWRRLRAVAAL